jgi:hypothetical protein
MSRYWLAAMAACLMFAALGCGGSDGRYPVSGDVTLQGQPLASGAILFESADGGSRNGTTITDGKYSLPASQGLLPGTYTVRVSAVQSQAEAGPPGPPGPEAAAIERSNKDVVPDEYNARSTLKHEVGPDKPTEFDIAVP